MIWLPPPALSAPAESLGELLSRARAARDAGRYAEALAAYDAMLAQVPDHETALLERARTLAWAGRFRESEAAWRGFRQRYPTRGLEADLGLAQAQAWDNRSGEAAGTLDPWVRRGERRAVLDAATYRSWEGRLGDALERLAAWLAEHPEDGEARVLEARFLGWDGRFDAARAAYAKVPAGDSRAFEAQIGLAQLDLWEGRPQAARDRMAALSLQDRARPEAALAAARAEAALGHPREARAAVRGARRGAARKEAQETLADLVESQGAWVQLDGSRTATNEGLVQGAAALRVRLPLGEGSVQLEAARQGLSLGAADERPSAFGLRVTQPLGSRVRLSAGAARRSDVGGEAATDHSLGLGLTLAPGLNLDLAHSLAWADYTPSSLQRRIALRGTEGTLSWRFGSGRNLLSLGAGRTEVSAGSTRRSFLGAYEHRLPLDAFELRGGLVYRGFGYSETLPLGFFNPERYRFQGLTAGLGWRRRPFEASLDGRVGRQTVNQGPATTAWSWGLNLAWTPVDRAPALFAGYSASAVALPVAAVTDPSAYRDHTVTAGLRWRLGLGPGRE